MSSTAGTVAPDKGGGGDTQHTAPESKENLHDNKDKDKEKQQTEDNKQQQQRQNRKSDSQPRNDNRNERRRSSAAANQNQQQQKERKESSRSGSRHNSQSNGEKKEQNKAQGQQNQNQNQSRRKEWSQRKSLSQGGASTGNKQNEGGGGGGKGVKDEQKERTRSSNSQSGSSSKRSQRYSTRTLSQESGEGYACSDEYELDEPFSDSDDDSSRPRQPQKMNLAIPRGRIRTLSGTVPIVGYSPKWGGPTMCLSCLQFFDLPDQINDFAEHLLIEHKIVVSEMNLIVDPKRYIEYWRQRFAKESIDKIFPTVEVQQGSPYFGITDYFYNMSEALSEDYSLRQRLAMRRLEEALSCQQREREDSTFQLQCIFCRYTARGNRSKIIHHLYMIHHLNLGSPDNLVFVTEYIEHLKEKLIRNECIYCEKTFQDRNTLMDHMRKRNHREVNPKNHYYDKFYIINYLELGKRWLDVLAEDPADDPDETVKPHPESDDEEEEKDHSWHEWQEDNVDLDDTRVLCLVCDQSEETCKALLEHMKETHELDLLKLIKDNNLDLYKRLKFINYIRKQNYNAACWQCQRHDFENPLVCNRHLVEHKPFHTLPDTAAWDTEEHLVPMFGNDHLLWMLESMLEENEGASDAEERSKREKEQHKKFEAIIEESKKNTVEGVIAEDLPELEEIGEQTLQELSSNEQTTTTSPSAAK